MNIFKKKNILRLLLWEECNRTCQGCCNKDWDLSSLDAYDADERGTDIEIIDLLADLMHYCEGEGLDFGRCLLQADVHFCIEL